MALGTVFVLMPEYISHPAYQGKVWITAQGYSMYMMCAACSNKQSNGIDVIDIRKREKEKSHQNESSKPSHPKSFNRMMLQVIPCLQNAHVHLLYHVPKLHSKPTQYLPLPHIIFGIYPCLNLLVVNHPQSKTLPHVCRV